MTPDQLAEYIEQLKQQQAIRLEQARLAGGAYDPILRRWVSIEKEK